MNKPELLSPAGDFEKLQIAIAYGADAVYLGGKHLSLRANAKNFDTDELENAVNYAHARNVKVYVGVNIFAHNRDIVDVDAYLRTIKELNADAVIIADPGVFNIARKIKGLVIHISTQANVTNHESAAFYHQLGASRIILARELNNREIHEIREKNPGLELEVFAHGAMCVSYSGRCLMSSYMTGRDANKGDCAQPCRSEYFLYEEQRPGAYMPVHEDERGTYILNSKDLCLVEHIPALVAAGVTGLKIEGRMKSPYYTATVTHAYRQAIDDFFASESLYESRKQYYLDELKKSATRDFTTGFFTGNPQDTLSYTHTSIRAAQDFLGIVTAYDPETQTATVEQRNKFETGDEVEFIKSRQTQTITDMRDRENAPVFIANKVKQLLNFKVNNPVDIFDIMRKRV